MKPVGEYATVAVSGLHRGDNPQPGPAVIAGMRRRFPGLRVVGLSYDPLESGLYSHGSDQVDAAYLMPYPRTGPAALMERLGEVIRRERIDAIVPCLDSELSNFIAVEGRLGELGVRTMLPGRASLERRSKARLSGFCHRLGIAAPATLAASDPLPLARFAERLGYPVYVKGKYYHAHLAETPAALHGWFHELFRVWGGPVLVQEALAGEEYDVVGVGDGHGGLVGHCAIRKLLRTAAGKGFGGVVVENATLEETVRRIISALRWRGPFELEFIKAPGRPFALLEMNPRFPAWVHFPSQIGCNLPARVLEHLMGMEPQALAHCPAGRLFVRHCVDLVGDIGELAAMASRGERDRAAVPPASR